MDYERFKEGFQDALKAELAVRGADVELTARRVDKMNESYDAITVRPTDSCKMTSCQIGTKSFSFIGYCSLLYDIPLWHITTFILFISEEFVNAIYLIQKLKTVFERQEGFDLIY